ncbi:hypothetical protein CCUS01_07247 [Colletotrichum cuscutae]|uniref:Cytochrome P450 n=1 Tax=Colletotrichum cuscutae TaxID=1209917 RepID=A0AAI9UXG8_9PEZI|nr:hypothetical protein CCUS01_07247 [Colletotrichum cuscutae]
MGLNVVLLAQALGALAAFYVAKFVVRLVQVRSRVRAVSKDHGVEVLPHSFIFGHLLLVGKLMAKQPPGLNGQVLPLLLLREYPDLCKKGLVYVDTWPIGPPMIAVFHPKVADQFTQERSLPKHSMMKEEFHPLTGCDDLVNMEGQTWKTWRAVLNPGFSARNILSLVPAMVEEALLLKKSFEPLADSGATVALENGVMKATVDPAQSPKAINPLRPFQMLYYNYVMKREIVPHIERQLKENISERSNSNGPKTVNSLAITSYIKEVSAAGSKAEAKLDSQFIDIAVSQLKIFLLAGHDTTASALCFAWYLMSKYPGILEKVRSEHDEVLGSDASAAASRIVENPALLNHLPYTNAVPKETLRVGLEVQFDLGIRPRLRRG